MGAIVDSKAFKAGNSVAVRLPKAFGIAEGTELQLEQTPLGILVREKVDAAEVKRKWHALLDAMREMPGPGRVQTREPIIFRDD